jgi:hypothetical protein
MNGKEYHARIKELRDEMESISRDFFAPIITEYDDLFAAAEKPSKINVSALARKYGTSQNALHKRLFGKPI